MPPASVATSASSDPSSARAGVDRRERLLWGFAVLVAIATVLFELRLQQQFDALGVLTQDNVLFEADPLEVIDATAHGSDRRGLVHPNIANFSSLPFRAVAKVVARLAGQNFEYEEALRRKLALLVVPVLSGVYPLVFLAIFRRLGLSRVASAALLVLSVVSFSRLIFGAVPETYGITAVAFAVMLWLFLQAQQDDSRLARWGMIAVAIVATGITITNVVSFGILYWLLPQVRRTGWVRSALHTGLLAVGIVAINIAGNYVGNRLYDEPMKTLRNESNWVQRWLFRYNPAYQVARFPYALTDSVAPAAPGQIPAKVPRESWHRYWFWFTFEQPLKLFSLQTLLSYAVVGFLAASFWLLRPADRPPWQWLLAGTALIIGYNCALHSVWGGAERFLYSNHWHPFLMLAIAGGVFALERRWRATSSILVLIVAALGAHNFRVLAYLLQVLVAQDGAPGPLT